MPTPDRDFPRIGRQSTDGRHYLTVGALVVALLVGAYVLLGAPGLHTPVANAPGVQDMEVATQQPDTPASGAPTATSER